MIRHFTISILLIGSASAETALTIYNRDLAVVRETLPLELTAGDTTLSFDRATAQVIPDSVVLRDPTGNAQFSILEQSYRNDPVSRQFLLSQFEGEVIEFEKEHKDGQVETIKGKVVRSGYVPGGRNLQPVIEVEGKMRFTLPGEPLFPALGDHSILRPTLGWQINSAQEAKFDAQLSYLSNGFRWEADYNFVAPEKGETVTVTGWVTVDNKSGTGFTDSKIKLVAGDVNVVNEVMHRGMRAKRAKGALQLAEAVQEKAFDDFHLYTLPRPLTIRNQETKQVEFIRAPKVTASKAYYYDPASGYRYRGSRNNSPLKGQTFSNDVSIFWEFTNDEASGLGMPLPAGRVRFYRSDNDDGNLEFVGENNIDHTPRNEEVRIYTGNAFDLVGERKITDFKKGKRDDWMSETVEVIVKNRSKESKTITVREHLWRGRNWEIQKPTMKFKKTDAHTIEFEVPLKPDESKTVTFTAHYTW